MSRRKRVWYPGATYHIIGRGNYRQPICRDEEDNEIFSVMIMNTMEKYAFKVHAYCLMSNHYHFLIETNEVEIWHIMKKLNQSFACYFNQKYDLIGHLFQGRYKAFLVRDDDYFLQTSRYIHMNPVKAQVVQHPEDYEWSSYRTLIGMDQLRFIDTARTHAYFKKPQRKAYQGFVENMSSNGQGDENNMLMSIEG